MKTLKRLIILFVLFFLYAYIISIDNIPNSIAIFKGDQIKISTLWGVNVRRESNSIEASTNLSDSTFENIGEEKLEVNLFGKIKLKTIDVSIMENIDVIPVGQVVGIKLYTSGVLVVGTSSIENQSGEICKPYENSQIQEGDTIVAINGNIINNSNELMTIINESNGEEINITYIRDNEQYTTKIVPIKNKEGSYKIGLWVRDSAAGLGTVTFYNEDTKTFAALGHAITDIDTGNIINTSSGDIDSVDIVSIIKGEKDEPGKIQGTIKQNAIIGNIYSNTRYGIYGIIKNSENLNLNYSKKMKVASRREIQLGNAYILCGIDGQIKEYKIDIQKIFVNNNYDNKSMLIKIKDEQLIEKTGGIIQGMIGSPIIQNGKLIGAVTHVFVNNPQIGYAVFGDIMINQLNEISN